MPETVYCKLRGHALKLLAMPVYLAWALGRTFWILFAVIVAGLVIAWLAR